MSFTFDQTEMTFQYSYPELSVVVNRNNVRPYVNPSLLQMISASEQAKAAYESELEAKEPELESYVSQYEFCKSNHEEYQAKNGSITPVMLSEIEGLAASVESLSTQIEGLKNAIAQENEKLESYKLQLPPPYERVEDSAFTVNIFE